MEIKRNYYLNKLISKQNNKLIKIVTGIRRCGKSYLLDPIFRNYLLDNGVDENHIIKLEFDSIENEEYTNHKKLYEYVMQKWLTRILIMLFWMRYKKYQILKVS